MKLLENAHAKMRRFARKHRCRRKAITIIYYEFACPYS